MDKAELCETELHSAQEMYLRFWQRVWEGQECHWPTEFQGGVNDLHALGYCEYETGYPEDDYRYAAIIWANVLCHRTPLNFGIDQSGGIVIKTEDWPSLCITPSSFIRDIANSSDTQYELFELATCQVLCRLAEHDYFDEAEVDPELLKFIRDSDIDYAQMLSFKLKAYVKFVHAEEG